MPEYVWAAIKFLWATGAAQQLVVSAFVFWFIRALFERRVTFSTIRHVWRDRHTATDIMYWFSNRWVSGPLFNIAIVYFLSTLPLFQNFNLPLATELSALPFWAQVGICLFFQDLMAYWRHRFSHSNLLWPIHAAHHSSKTLTWLSAMREHFLDIFLINLFGGVALLLFGFKVSVIAVCSVIRFYWVSFVHMNLNFSLGILDYIIVTPRFHRWHHVPDRNGNWNYSGIFSFLDLAFGTFYLPRNQTPTRFGVGEKYPEGFFVQLVHPFIVYAQRIKRWTYRRQD